MKNYEKPEEELPCCFKIDLSNLTNGTANKIFYTCSTESFLLRYKKLSKEGAKQGSVLQCSVHIF